MFIKYANATFSIEEIHKPEVALKNNEVKERFYKIATDLKKVVPKANDFLFFSAVMLHSAEASLIDQSTGEIILKNGKPVEAKWEVNDKTGSWKWVCSDPNIKAYKNNNGDIFPEIELKKAYRKWVGKPLCKDHQSSSVDGVRGIIVDTYWDDKRKRVIGLCALDKVNYPDLARKVQAGYANNVSMGTAVGKSICYECGNVALNESQYCNHVRNRTTYGEVNVDLAPIELSLVVTGADPRAKLKTIVASLNKYSDEKSNRIKELRAAGCVTPGEMERLEGEVNDIKKSLAELKVLIKTADVNEQAEQGRSLAMLRDNTEDQDLKSMINKVIVANAELDDDDASAIRNLAEQLKMFDTDSLKSTADQKAKLILDKYTNKTEEVFPMASTLNGKEPGGTQFSNQDPVGSGNPAYGDNPNVSLSSQELNLIKNLYSKVNQVEEKLNKFSKEEIMSDKLKARARARRELFEKVAYHQGGGGANEPQTYPVDPMNDKLKTDGDKQMEGQGMEPGSDGLHPGYESYGNELDLKKKLSRADLEQRKMRRQALLSQAMEGGLYKSKEGKVYNEAGEELEKVNMADEGFAPGTELPMSDEAAEKLAPDFDDEEFDAEVDAILAKLAPNDADVLKDALKKKAYMLGTEEPKTYPVDPLNDKLKTDGDKQMEGQGMEPGSDGLHPGYQSYGDELKLKEKVLRAGEKLSGRFVAAYDEDGALNKEASKWDFYAGKELVLTASGVEAFEDEIEQKWETFASKSYGREVIRAIRSEGLSKVAYLLKGDAILKKAEDMPELEAPEMDLPEVDAPEMDLPEGEDVPDEMPEESDLDTQELSQLVSTLEDTLSDAEKVLSDLRSQLGEDDMAELPEVAEANDGISNVVSALDQSADELAILAVSLDGRLEKKSFDKVTTEMVRLAKEAIEENKELISVAKNTLGEMTKVASSKLEVLAANRRKQVRENLTKTATSLEEALDSLLEEEAMEPEHADNEELQEYVGEEDELMAYDEMYAVDEMEAEDMSYADDLDALLEELESEEEMDASDCGDMYALDATASDRKAWREKVAKMCSDCNTDMPVMETKKLDGLAPVSEGGDEVEGIMEQHDKIMKAVENVPAVREAMGRLVQLMKVGALNDSDLNDEDKLTALAVDPEAVKYYKEYFSTDQAEKEFASELVKDYEGKKATASLENHKLRLKRAYDLAFEMQEKGMINQGVNALHDQASNLVDLSDKAFDSMKRSIARMSAPVKTASPVIQPGLNAEEPNVSVDEDFRTQLMRVFDK